MCGQRTLEHLSVRASACQKFPQNLQRLAPGMLLEILRDFDSS
jgi:hypothetical protein